MDEERARREAEGLNAAIIRYLREDPRRSWQSIAKRVGITSGAVKERTKKLMDAGVLSIDVSINHDRLGSDALNAYVEVTYPGDADVYTLLDDLRTLDPLRIREAMTMIGDVDALLRVRTRDVADLRKLVMDIRSSKDVVSTKTWIVAGTAWHGSKRGAGEANDST
jgi:DNA-binding Lrp family transcriptional regulator